MLNKGKARGRKMPTYQQYVYQYQNKKAQLERKGYTMTDKMYSKSDYEWMYRSAFKKQKQEVLLGKRKTVNNVLRDMINDQAYAYSRKQALSFKKAAEDLGQEKQALMEYMMYSKASTNITDLIEEEAKKLYKMGKTSKEVALFIGQTFFGSE